MKGTSVFISISVNKDEFYLFEYQHYKKLNKKEALELRDNIISKLKNPKNYIVGVEKEQE